MFRFDGWIDRVIAVHLADGLVTGLYAVRDPEELSRMEREAALRAAETRHGLRSGDVRARPRGPPRRRA
ncbi:hypothetical protein [Streptomyces cinerochromogenes]|uniref:hypothetical protein n=1 Tax=Streptomyces cinerochromogenes TaxID=66422 RepID=UPI0033B0FF75